MWPLRKTNRRRVETRRSSAANGQSLWRRFWNAGGAGSVLLAAVFCAAALVMDLWPMNPLPYRVGQFVPQDIHSRVTFEVPPSEAELRNAQRNVSNRMPASFGINTSVIDDIVGRLRNLPALLVQATQPDQLQKLGFPGPDAPGLAEWRDMAQVERQAAMTRMIDQLRTALSQQFLVRPEEAQAQRERKAAQFKAIGEKTTMRRDISELVGLNETNAIDEAAKKLAEIFPPALQPRLRQYLAVELNSGRPTYTYDAAATEKDKQEAYDLLRHDPSLYKRYAVSDLLVSGSRVGAHDRQDVRLGYSDVELLRAEQAEFLAEQYQHRPVQYWGQIAGRAIVLLMVALVMCLYIARFRRALVKDHWQCGMLVIMLLLMLALVKLITFLGWPVQLSLWPVLVAAIILTIAFSQRLAWAVGMLFGLVVVLQLRADFWTFLVYLLSITAAVLQLAEIRSRSKLIVMSLITAIVLFAVYWATQIAAGTPSSLIFRESLWCAGSAFLAGLLVQGLLPGIERMFGVATSMTLLEWADASKPVLKRLAMEAPGTYNHSLQLGALCEAAAEAIGVRGLLARVGAYYHDIGKINKPDYFVENQAGSASKHAKLSPAMSLLIIVGHVKDGIELAYEYGLPKVLHEFIVSHHGTTLVQYFYQAATEQRKTDADRAPDEVEFRYPGPKPRTKEAAILMLADAAESSVRSMGEPTPGRIENQVHTMVTRRLMDGQLNECDLTLSEVHQIETSLIKSLASMHHLRVAYPTPTGQRPSASELLAARKEEEKSSQGKSSQ